ncbi:peptide ABC transporter substrate-binding protein [Devosia oryziradicis]|uniref:Peptide ABC transporter substrate-binding protein n=1 Tax=Devosia oryziradicis TaxID=2801335 RepID=A0ABX7BZU2_9HYPH|nr:peptide ABC transporter substrate-binding protein [Devosia oryziradicis]QQR37063.1 peptide ABC transporter substrate-binding protein [Devosia oryziradicis]
MKLTQTLTAVATAGLMAALMTSAASAVTLNVMNGSEPGSIDPHQASGDWEDRIIGDYLEGLMTDDAEANPIPGQAESYTISDDGLVYTFKLRDGIQWSDGVPVTAGDFVYAFQRLFDPKTASDYAYLQFPIKNGSEIADGSVTNFDELGVKAIDDKTLEITLEGPTPYFLGALTHYTAFPVPKHIVEKVGNDWTKVENIVSNGAYTPVEWVPGNYIKLAKSETYWDAANVQIDEVNRFVQDDLAAALARYRAGEYDILTDIPSDQAEWIKTNLPGQDYFTPFLGVYYYVINQEKEPFDNAEVRKALSMAINRDVIGPDVLGTGEVPAYGWVPPGTGNYEGVDLYEPDWIGLSYEERVAEAKTIMEGLGYTSSSPLTLQLKYNTNDNHQRIAVAIAAMWEQIGVKAELFNSETAVHYDSLRSGDFEVGRAGWLLDYSDPSNTLDLLRQGVEQDGTMNWGNNYGRYANDEFDALMDKASSELDLAARAEMLGQAEEIAMDETAAIPIYWYIAQNVVAPTVTGFVNNARDTHRTRWLTKSE